MDNHHHARAHRVLFGVDMVKPATDAEIAVWKYQAYHSRQVVNRLIARIEADAKEKEELLAGIHAKNDRLSFIGGQLQEARKRIEADAKVIHDCRRALGTARDRLMMHEPYTNSIDYEVVKGIEKMLAALAERGE